MRSRWAGQEQSCNIEDHRYNTNDWQRHKLNILKYKWFPHVFLNHLILMCICVCKLNNNQIIFRFSTCWTDDVLCAVFCVWWFNNTCVKTHLLITSVKMFWPIWLVYIKYNISLIRNITCFFLFKLHVLLKVMFSFSLQYLAKKLGFDTLWFGYLQTTVGVIQLIGGPMFGRWVWNVKMRAATDEFLSGLSRLVKERITCKRC